MDALLSLKQRLDCAAQSTSDVDRRNAYLDAFTEYGAHATETLSAKTSKQNEAVLKDWAEALEKAKPHLLERQLLFSHSRYQAACGSAAEILGLQTYFEFGDFVDAPRLLEKAEIHHQRSAEFASKVTFPENSPPQATQMRERVAAMQKAEAERVRGMRLLVQGEFESESGGLDRATTLLTEAVAVMRSAEQHTPNDTDGDAVAAITGDGERRLNFIDFAEALLHKTQSDQALLQGRLSQAAASEAKRADALKRCQSMHLRVGRDLHEGFARRLARDIHVAHLRHDRFVAEANKRPRWEWLKAIIFFAMAAGSAAFFMWLAGRFEILQNQTVFAVLLLFVMAIAGIGARLVEWREAANWLRSAKP